MERFSPNKPTHLELSVAWWTLANMHGNFTVRSFLGETYTQDRLYKFHWFQLIISAIKGEI